MSTVSQAPQQTNVRAEVSAPEGTNVRASWVSRLIYQLGEALPGVAAPLAEAVWTRPRRYEQPQRERALIGDATPLRLGIGLGSMAGWSWGEGPTVLLVHGWEGRGAQLGSFVGPLLASGYRVVTYDAPAHGQSAGRRASLFTFADAIQAAIRQVGPVHAIVSHSMGGAATLLAAQGGLDVDRLVLVSPANADEAPGRFLRYLGLGPAVLARFRSRIAGRHGVGMRAVAGPELARSVDTPSLVVHDHADRYVPWADGAEIAEALPYSTLYTTNGLGHHRILRDDDVIDEVVRFLQSDRSSAAQARRATASMRP
jgi:pimeloyl-ACP methyl ester carboxylesterase